MMTASRTTTRIANGRTEDIGMQTGTVCGRENPTNTAPNTNRVPTRICGPSWPIPDFDPPFTTHNKYCSIENRPSWSKRVEKMMPTWQEVVAAVSMNIDIKSV